VFLCQGGSPPFDIGLIENQEQKATPPPDRRRTYGLDVGAWNWMAATPSLTAKRGIGAADFMAFIGIQCGEE
jgi:hypothetical protein